RREPTEDGGDGKIEGATYQRENRVDGYTEEEQGNKDRPLPARSLPEQRPIEPAGLPPPRAKPRPPRTGPEVHRPTEHDQDDEEHYLDVPEHRGGADQRSDHAGVGVGGRGERLPKQLGSVA